MPDTKRPKLDNGDVEPMDLEDDGVDDDLVARFFEGSQIQNVQVSLILESGDVCLWAHVFKQATEEDQSVCSTRVEGLWDKLGHEGKCTTNTSLSSSQIVSSKSSAAFPALHVVIWIFTTCWNPILLLLLLRGTRL